MGLITNTQIQLQICFIPNSSLCSGPSRCSSSAAGLVVAMAQAQRSSRSRDCCTLSFGLHLAVMILGIVGVILAIVATALVAGNSNRYKANGGHGAAIGSAIWLLLTTVLIFVSGLQGITIRNVGSKWHACFVALAVVVLVDLGILIIAASLVSSAVWIIYMIAVFVMELWVLCLRTCCKPMEVDVVATELPIANPGASDREYSVDMSGQAYPPTLYQASSLKISRH